MFETGEWPYWRANCTVQKEWRPEEAVACVPRTCESDPTAPYMGQDMDWPFNDRRMGSRVTYTCPYKVQYFQDRLRCELRIS